MYLQSEQVHNKLVCSKISRGRISKIYLQGTFVLELLILMGNDKLAKSPDCFTFCKMVNIGKACGSICFVLERKQISFFDLFWFDVVQEKTADF